MKMVCVAGIKLLVSRLSWQKQMHIAKQKSNVDDLERSFRTPAKPQP